MMQTMIAPPIAFSQNASDIRQALAESKHLIATGQFEAAAFQLCAAFEAAIRLSFTDLGKRTEDPIKISDNHSGLTTQAVAHGIIDPEDRAVLRQFLSMCDAASHGGRKITDATILHKVNWITERTLDEMQEQKI